MLSIALETGAQPDRNFQNTGVNKTAAAPPHSTYLLLGGIFASHLVLLRGQSTDVPTKRASERVSKVSEPVSPRRGLLLCDARYFCSSEYIVVATRTTT